MTEYSAIVAPFQLILSFFVLRYLYHRLSPPTFLVIAITVFADFCALFDSSVFPLSSFFIIVAILRYHEKSWATVLYAFAMNAGMYVVYAKIPYGQFFVTAVNYYVAYNVLNAFSTNEIHIKNALYYASLKHLAVASTFWFDAPVFFRVATDSLSVIVSYYLVRASLYYLAKGKEANATKKAKTA